MTILYKEFVKNLKHTFEMVGEETVQVPAKIDINERMRLKSMAEK